MDADEMRQLTEEFAWLGEYYRQPLGDHVCAMYVQDLRDLPFQSVSRALRRMREDPRRRQPPLPAEVRDAAKPAGTGHTHAVDLAARIAKAISSYGYYQAARAEQFIGPVGWGVVERMGGWQPLCQSLTTDRLQTFYAQTREMCRVALEDVARETDTSSGSLLSSSLTKALR